MTWLLDGRFYTYRFVAQEGMEVILGESGANDPDFNLRREPLVIQRLSDSSEATFVSVLEPHGLYDGATEQTIDSDSRIAALRHVEAGDYDIILIETLAGEQVAIAISWDNDPAASHSTTIEGRSLAWQGFAARITFGE